MLHGNNLSYIKCHKCRHILLQDITSTYRTSCSSSCSSYKINSFIYILEELMPPWIKLKVESEQWTKGKLHCENCGCKVGTFDFVSGRKCECGLTVLPPIHLISSQVDIPIALSHGLNK